MKGCSLSASVVTRLRENTTSAEGLHHFDITNSYIGPAEIAAIGDCIKYNGSNCEGMAPLISIDVSSNVICGVNSLGRGTLNSDGLEDFCSCLIAINKVSRLRKLNFSKNVLGDCGFAAVSNLLAVGPTSLCELYLRGCSAGPEAFEKLLEGLKQNKSLQVLDVRENPIGPSAVSGIGDFLSSNPRLKQLFISSCQLQATGCISIFQSLHNNFGLEALTIGDNGCGDDACEAIQLFLKSNQRLRALDLQENNIGNEGAAAIGKGLAKNRSLTFLGLQWNSLDNHGAAALGEGLASNSTLRGLHILGTFIDEEGVKGLVESSMTLNEKPVDIDMAFNLRPTSRIRRRHPGRQSIELDPAALAAAGSVLTGELGGLSGTTSPVAAEMSREGSTRPSTRGSPRPSSAKPLA